MDATRQTMRRIVTGIVEQDEDEPVSGDPFEANKAEFGTTEVLGDAFYILPDGTLLDGAGVNQGGSSGGGRAWDHRNIRHTGGGTQGMQEFMALGAIRAMPENGALDFVVEPTLEQYTRIVQWAKNFNGEVIIEMERGLGEFDERDEVYRRNPDRAYEEFDEGASPRKVLGFIKRFWKQEQVNEMLGTHWGWVLPDGSLIEGQDTQSLAREFHGELVYKYWGDNDMYPTEGGGMDFAYRWAYWNGWIRYVGNNISAADKTTREAWDSLIRNHVMVHGRKGEWWYIDPVEFSFGDDDFPREIAITDGFQIPWEDLIDTKSVRDAVTVHKRRSFGRMIGLGEQLLVTPDQMDYARDVKKQVIAMIDIGLFHHITTENNAQIQSKFQDAHPLDDYNKWSEEGKILHIPFLMIGIEPDGSAHVTGHEGRTRAAAMSKAGYKRMPIGIQIRWGYDWSDNEKRKSAVVKQKYDRELKFEDLPPEISYQFRSHLIFKRDQLDPILDGDEQIVPANASKVMAAQSVK